MPAVPVGVHSDSVSEAAMLAFGRAGVLGAASASASADVIKCFSLHSSRSLLDITFR